MSFLLERLDARHLFALVHCTARVLHYFFFYFFFVYFLENTPRVDQVMITLSWCVLFSLFFFSFFFFRVLYSFVRGARQIIPVTIYLYLCNLYPAFQNVNMIGK